jgi:hypothetical protein
MSDRTRIRQFWKPDGKKINADSENTLKNWMRQNSFSTAPGALTVLLHSRIHDSARANLARTLVGERAGKGKGGV